MTRSNGSPAAPRIPAKKVDDTIVSILFYEDRPVTSNQLFFKLAQRIPELKLKSVLNRLTDLTKAEKIRRHGKSIPYSYSHPDVLLKDTTPAPAADFELPDLIDDENQEPAPLAETAAPAPQGHNTKRRRKKLERAEERAEERASTARPPTAPFLSTSLKFGDISCSVNFYIDVPDIAVRDQALAQLGQLAERAARVIDILGNLDAVRTKWEEERNAALQLAEESTKELVEIRQNAQHAAEYLTGVLGTTKAPTNEQSNGQTNGYSNGHSNGALQSTEVVVQS